MRFEIREDFYLDDKKFKILSGAIHYFRVHQNDWYHSLYNLKALGFNTVETYVPWNMHEEKKGEFNFQGILDIERFLQIAKELGLYAIVRPSPFICAEWEFGGMPAWLLEKDMRIRSSDDRFIKEVAEYYDVLLAKLRPHLLENGGNILMMQVENEYGSYGEDKEYLRKIKNLMIERGISCPLFTSDGPWQATLRAGTLIEEDLFVTGNFGSKADFNFSQMKSFLEKQDKKWPLMCMEFWDGWFNRWKEPIIKRDPEELAEAVYDVIKQASINLYMFHGGTNFAFMNGCSARGTIDLPQVTSYDYDALLNEEGNPTEKYYAVKKMMEKHFPEYETCEPLIKENFEKRDIPLIAKTSLLENLDNLSKSIKSQYPMNMEALGQNFGYTLYRTDAIWDAEKEKIRIIDASDRVQLYVDGKLIATQYQTEIGEDIFVEADLDKKHEIDILVENMGRVNYGHKFLASTQKKGIRYGVCKDLHFMLNWEQYCLDFKDISKIDYDRPYTKGQASFYKYEFELSKDEILSTHIDMSDFGKGVVFVNGNNIGRYYSVGPTMSLYIPAGYLKEKNEIVIFDTEDIYSDKINLLKSPKFKEVEGENL